MEAFSGLIHKQNICSKGAELEMQCDLNITSYAVSTSSLDHLQNANTEGKA